MTEKCPIIKNCNKITKMDCSNRDYTECDFYKSCLKEKKKKIVGIRK